jgi:hypothetical protein
MARSPSFMTRRKIAFMRKKRFLPLSFNSLIRQ